MRSVYYFSRNEIEDFAEKLNILKIEAQGLWEDYESVGGVNNNGEMDEETTVEYLMNLGAGKVGIGEVINVISKHIRHDQ
jgi:hypothetical protein